jgi:hypothetical protein
MDESGQETDECVYEIGDTEYTQKRHVKQSRSAAHKIWKRTVNVKTADYRRTRARMNHGAHGRTTASSRRRARRNSYRSVDYTAFLSFVDAPGGGKAGGLSKPQSKVRLFVGFSDDRGLIVI